MCERSISASFTLLTNSNACDSYATARATSQVRSLFVDVATAQSDDMCLFDINVDTNRFLLKTKRRESRTTALF